MRVFALDLLLAVVVEALGSILASGSDGCHVMRSEYVSTMLNAIPAFATSDFIPRRTLGTAG
jgi:hypothetical protein